MATLPADAVNRSGSVFKFVLGSTRLDFEFCAIGMMVYEL